MRPRAAVRRRCAWVPWYCPQQNTNIVLNNLKISTRLLGTMGLMLVLLMAVVGMALWQKASMRSLAHEIGGNALPSVERVNQMSAGLAELHLRKVQHVLNDDAAAMAAIEADLARLLADFQAADKAFAALLSSDDERKVHDTFVAEWKRYLATHDQVLALSRSNENDKAMALLTGESMQRYGAVREQLDKMARYNSDAAKTLSAEVDLAYASSLKSMLAVVALAMALVVAAALWLIRSITGPVNRVVAAVDRVAAGNFSVAIQSGSKDEIGQVLLALDRMQSGLARVVSDVRQSSESVATASVEIAQGNLDLSQRTEQQASALQQTAASMDELSATVKQNADNARQANQLAQQASTVAVQGGDMVGQVVQTMRGINDSSKRIAEIIGTIDGIAFQTNILALNAAVEAARAGEQGRGFAVVAGEVRNLAQRSSEAAREIKSLISASVERVALGTTQVDQAGAKMTDVVDSIKRVTDIMGEISAASAEQSTGVGQVGQAVSQMDQATQQNAALVEENAAAADSLKGQAQQLVQAVAVFKLA